MVQKKQQKANFGEYDMRTIFLATMAILTVGFVIMITLLVSLNMRIDEMMEIQGRYNFNSVNLKKTTNGTSPSSSATKAGSAEKFKSTLERKGNVLTVRVQVDHKPNRIFEGQSEQNEKMPLLEVLDEIEEAKGLHVEYETAGNQTVVKAIDGIDVKTAYKLEYYVNGQLVTEDLNRAKVGVGDVVEIVTL